jgi:hypothetical protein
MCQVQHVDCNLCGGHPAGCESFPTDITLQVFKKYGKTFDLWCEIDVGHLTDGALSRLISHNSDGEKWCRIKRKGGFYGE